MSDDKTPLPACYHHGAITAQLHDHERRIAHNHRNHAKLVNGAVLQLQKRQVAIAGEGGKNGMVGDMRKDVEENTKANKATDARVTKLEMRSNLVPAGTAGVVVAIAEVLSRVL